MIRYTLICDEGHRFESWFQSADAFDKLLAAGMVSCAVCAGTKVSKTLMTPSVATEASNAPDPRPGAVTPPEKAIAELKRKIEENSDYVGLRFAQEARDMHDGTIPERPIHGEARLDEAKRLIEDGIPVAPLPFMPTRKTN
ncbi:hypothetical protein RGUI_2925 [Rhodovulum sp. P5]|uniref:DUF1178 family protein n=1 Tax=Rhodovulum sp. P5 TaxID=1564506 RepID=UPI0009C1BBE0|nr:DUF1178 family protein [Rhodovulum sp. P5]ARE41066.1 hypothetical protein RGUI_2925 [Rhodovulum sp. P5]